MAWVDGERQALVETLRTTSPDAPTLCAGWDTRHLLAHLVQREHSLTATLGDAVVKREPGDEKYLGRLVALAETPAGYAALVDRFLAGPPRWSPMSWAGETVNLVEYVIHHEDVRRGVGPVEPRVLPAAELDALWAKVAMLGRLGFRKSPVGVAFARPEGSRQVVKKGPGVVVTGEPVELALYASGRRDAAVVELTGAPDAVASFQTWVATT